MFSRRLRALLRTLVVIVLCAGAAGSRTRVAKAACANAIACENQLPGTPRATWDVGPQPMPFSIEGFTTAASVGHGGSIDFKVHTAATSYRIDIYRLGWYGGDGARLEGRIRPSVALPQRQPSCIRDAATGETDCGNWSVSASWAVPATAVSGVYLANLIRTDGAGGAYPIVFVVRDDAARTRLVFQTDDSTEQAYNQWGGNSLYKGTWGPGINGRAFAVSYDRPSTDPELNRTASFFYAEYPMLRWLERNGYDVSYVAGVDSAQSASLLQQHQVFLDVGHDEYVSDGERANIESAEANGVDLAYFSGNETFWKTRFARSLDTSHRRFRTLVCYKEPDATDPSTAWTGIWGDTRAPGISGTLPNALSGTLSDAVLAPAAGTPLDVPYAYSRLRLWRSTSVARLSPGQTAALGDHIVGYEWDIDADNGQRPAGELDGSATPQSHVQLFDWKTYAYVTGNAVHQVTEHRAPSGALVFGGGTVQWSWALDGTHVPGTSTPSRTLQQATVNVLADMHVQPHTLQSGLVAATPSTDATPPSSAISAPANGAVLARGATYTISGSGRDAGGVVAATEISVDGGVRWHPAATSADRTSTTWSYRWTPAADGAYTLEARSVDDSANLEQSAAKRSVTVTG